jgi:hypothetical protein
VRSVTPGGACHHSRNSGNVRSSTLGELFTHRQVQQTLITGEAMSTRLA